MSEDYIGWVPTVLTIARAAAVRIMAYYQENDLENIKTRIKDDASPVTEADMSAHRIITKGLLEFTPSIPVFSEEGVMVPFKERTTWSRYWLVDPLDGTQEFLARTGEFAVNIALIENNDPVLGVVIVPLMQEAYWAVKGHSAYYQQEDGNPKHIRVRTELTDVIRVAVSRRHDRHRSELKAFLERLGHLYEGKAEVVLITCGSALKICLVAAGLADIYPRFGKTGEWDTAAGQCILEAAGGILCDLTGNPLKYNTKFSPINTGFLAIGSEKLNNLFCG